MTEPNEQPLPDDAMTPSRPLASAGSQHASPTAPSTDGSAWHPSYLLLAVVSAVTVVADLGTKHWALTRLETDGVPTPVEVVKNAFGFVLARNRGGAWGLLQSTSEAIRKPFFLLVSCVAIVFIVSLYRRLSPTQRALQWGLPLVLGGAIGNLVDRIRYSWVVDFIDVHVVWSGRAYHWPTFNIADIAICVGVGLMAIDMFASRPKSAAPLAQAPISEPPADTTGTP